MDKEIENSPAELRTLSIDSRTFIIVGTAHVSRSSAELVDEVIKQEQPDTVCIELCDSRFKALEDESRWKNTDIIEIIRSGRTYVLMVQLALSSFQKQMAKKFGVRPGEEMHRAIECAKAHGSHLSLVDRDVKTTLKRAWGATSAWELTKLFFSSLAASFSGGEIREIDIEQMKSGDLLSELLGELGKELPGVKKVLIDERDYFMAEKIRTAPGKKIVAVVGAGHVPGICSILESANNAIDIAALETIPPSGWGTRIMVWGIPGSIIGIMLFGFYSAGLKAGAMLFSRWAIITGSLSALGGVLSLAHPATIISAFLCAPITTLHPAISAGTVCGLVEAYFRRPTVSDFEQVSDSISSISGIYRNRVTKILLVFLLTSVGAAIGTFVGAGSMIAALH